MLQIVTYLRKSKNSSADSSQENEMKQISKLLQKAKEVIIFIFAIRFVNELFHEIISELRYRAKNYIRN